MLGECRFRAAKYATVRLKSFPSLALGVGQDNDALSLVRSATLSSEKTFPLRIEPDFGQGAENVSKPPNKQPCDVFQDNECGSHFASQTDDLAEKAGAASGCAEAKDISDRSVLAGEASTDAINMSDLIPAKSAHIVKHRHFRPMGTKHTLIEFVLLAERYSLEPARTLQTEAETADAAEQVEQLVRHARGMSAFGRDGNRLGCVSTASPVGASRRARHFVTPRCFALYFRSA